MFQGKEDNETCARRDETRQGNATQHETALGKTRHMPQSLEQPSCLVIHPCFLAWWWRREGVSQGLLFCLQTHRHRHRQRQRQSQQAKTKTKTKGETKIKTKAKTNTKYKDKERHIDKDKERNKDKGEGKEGKYANTKHLKIIKHRSQHKSGAVVVGQGK